MLRLSIVLSVLISTSVASATVPSWRSRLESDCGLAMNQRKVTLLERASINSDSKVQKLSAEVQDTYRRLQALIASKPIVKDLFPHDGALLLLLDEEHPFYQKRIGEFVTALEKKGNYLTADRNFIASYKEFLDGAVNEKSIADRVATLQNYAELPAYLRESAAKRIFGQMELDEVQDLVHGGNPLKPTPGSLVGKFIKSRKTSSTVRKFNATHTGDGNQVAGQGLQGPERLVVSMGPSDRAEYLKLFNRHEFLVHMHQPQQGTLMIMHNGDLYTYSTVSVSRENDYGGYGEYYYSENTVMPHILLSTDEAERLTVSLNASTKIYQNGWGSVGRHPWEIPGYCARGGYTSCTHWIANLPIGKKRVSSYIFPGNADRHAGGAASAGPQEQKLGKIRRDVLDAIHQQYGTSQLEPAQKALLEKYVRQIWKSPGHEQLSSLLGPVEFEAAKNGEYANPGYVAIRLLGNVSQDRIPIVFRARQTDEQARQAVDPNFDPQIYAY